MDAYLRPLISCSLYTTIIRQRKKDFGEIEKNFKNTVKNMFTLEMQVTVRVWIIFAYCCARSYMWSLACMCMIIHVLCGRLFLHFGTSIHFCLLYLYVKSKNSFSSLFNDDDKFVPLLKSSLHTKKKNIYQLNPQLSHDLLRIHDTTSYQPCSIYILIHTHILTITYTTTQNNTQK